MQIMKYEWKNIKTTLFTIVSENHIQRNKLNKRYEKLIQKKTINNF